MKKILVYFLVSIVPLALAGCQGQSTGAAGPTKTYHMVGGTEISFQTPSEPWKETVQTIGEEQAELGMPADTVLGVSFKRPDKEGIIAIAAVPQAREIKKDKDGKPLLDKNKNPILGDEIELENDQETLNQIAMSVEKRDGERLKEEYIEDFVGGNAFHMVFEVGKPDRREKGENLHFTRDHKIFSISLIVPKADYDSQKGQFDTIVKTFTLKPGDQSAPPTPGATPPAK